MCGPGPDVNAPGISPSGIASKVSVEADAGVGVEPRFVASLLPLRIGSSAIESGELACAVKLVIVSDRGGVVCVCGGPCS